MISMGDLVRHYLKATPLSTGELRKQLAVADKLPPLSGAGLEYHCNQPAPRTDLLLRLGNFDGGRETLSLNHEWFEFDGSFTELSGWKPLLDFGREWADPDSPLFLRIENVWMEFDFPEHHEGSFPALIPSLFCDVGRRDHMNRHTIMDSVHRVLTLLAPQLSSASLKQIGTCLIRAPSSVRPDYIGVMLPRCTETVRTCLSGFESHQVIPYLQSIGWPGEYTTLADLLDTHISGFNGFILDLDIGRLPESSIGLEVFFSQHVDWENALLKMAKTGLCMPDAADELLRWPGVDELPSGTLRRYLTSAMQRDIRYLIRRLNHLKLSYDSQGKCAVKVYMYMGYA